MSWYNLCRSKKNELRPGFYDAVQDIPSADWDAVLDNRNIYLSLPYLMALENSMNEQVEFRYLLFYNEDNKPVSIASVQILDFSNDAFKKNEAFCKVADKIKSKFLEKFDLKMMVCGNVFACGENGFIHTSDISSEEAYNNLSNGLYQLRQRQKSEQPISVVLLKEFTPSSFQHSDTLKTAGFKDFKVDVNMVLKIHNNWKTMDDYLASMTTKFRTRAKGVFKKSKDIEIRTLNGEQMKQHINSIEELYHAVVERAEFKFGVLNGEAFMALKNNLQDDFIFKGYFLNNVMVGFSSAFISNNRLDANYVGLDYNHNASYAIYQRMLYDFVELSITHGVKELQLGRTAEEIKSCIGAEPMDMKLYLRHRNSISNHLISPIISSITPSEFELRYPFKADFVASI